MMSQEQKDQAAGLALLKIWKIFHAPRERIQQVEILTRIAEVIHSVPVELLNAINAEVRQRRDR
jgi:hypothetical protein